MLNSISRNLYIHIGSYCRTDSEKITYFDKYKDVFFYQNSKEIDDLFHIYANMKRLSESEMLDLISTDWLNMPDVFKIFAFDYCIRDANYSFQ